MSIEHTHRWERMLEGKTVWTVSWTVRMSLSESPKERKRREKASAQRKESISFKSKAMESCPTFIWLSKFHFLCVWVCVWVCLHGDTNTCYVLSLSALSLHSALCLRSFSLPISSKFHGKCHLLCYESENSCALSLFSESENERQHFPHCCYSCCWCYWCLLLLMLMLRAFCSPCSLTFWLSLYLSALHSLSPLSIPVLLLSWKCGAIFHCHRNGFLSMIWTSFSFGSRKHQNKFPSLVFFFLSVIVIFDKIVSWIFQFLKFFWFHYKSQTIYEIEIKEKNYGSKWKSVSKNRFWKKKIPNRSVKN